MSEALANANRLQDPNHPPFPTSTGAEFSPDKAHCYLLWRVWSPDFPLFGFIGLNPSTADATNDDPTVARCTNRARQLQHGGLVVGNLYGWRATDPSELRQQRHHGDPVGALNDAYLRKIGTLCPTILLGWGAHAEKGRAALVIGMLRAIPHPPRLIHLGLTSGGQPRHPLYIGYNTQYQELTA